MQKILADAKQRLSTSGSSTELDRLKAIHIQATANTPAEDVAYTYDATGRLLTVTDGSGSRTYAYEPVRKRLASVTTVLNGLPANKNTFVVSYDYNPDGSVWKMTSPAGITTYGYNKAGQLTSLADPFGHSTA